MGNFFAQNIDRTGRIVRAAGGVALIIAGILLSGRSGWACFLLVAGGVFALYEGVRGWCLMRACGIKTKL
jgi:O-antigen ligase